MKKALVSLLCLFTVCITCFAFIHRRVIRAYIKKETLPEPPEWHKKFFCHNSEE